MFQRVSCIAIAEIRSSYPDSSVEAMASRLSQPDLRECDLSTLSETVEDMLNKASHYKNWQKNLQVPGGVALVLGSSWAESS